MKAFFSVLFCTGIVISVYSQETFYFEIKEDKVNIDNVSNTQVSHPLGEEIALKVELLREEYVWEEPASATSPTPRNHIEKPSIYFAVKKMEKYFKKGVRKGELETDAAINKLESVLNTALYIRYQSTEDLEQELKKYKDPTELLNIFDEKIILTSGLY